MDFLLRPAGAADAPAIASLFRESFALTFQHLYPTGEMEGFLAEQSPAHFAACCTAADHAVFLGETLEGELLGYCLLGPYDLDRHIPDLLAGRRWWTMRQLYLQEAAKGSGLADALMARALDEARARGAEELLLTVWIGNHRARRFYERHGFAEVGKYPFVVGHIVDDDRILRRSL